MRRIPSWVWALLCVVVTTEAASLGALWILRRRTGLVYEPLRTSLSPSHREQLTRLLDGTLTYHRHHPLLGWSVRPHGVTERYRASRFETANSCSCRTL